MEKALVDAKRLLQKYPGKGGWTYALIPEVLQDKSKPFGWVTVRGFIDDYEIQQYKLMPKGDGQLFLPVKAAIRKQIKKEAGDYVHIVLYADHSKTQIPGDILECFKDEAPSILKTFQSFSDSEQKVYLDWILAAKTADTQADRILKMMGRLKKGLRFYDKE